VVQTSPCPTKACASNVPRPSYEGAQGSEWNHAGAQHAAAHDREPAKDSRSLLRVRQSRVHDKSQTSTTCLPEVRVCARMDVRRIQGLGKRQGVVVIHMTKKKVSKKSKAKAARSHARARAKRPSTKAQKKARVRSKPHKKPAKAVKRQRARKSASKSTASRSVARSAPRSAPRAAPKKAASIAPPTTALTEPAPPKPKRERKKGPRVCSVCGLLGHNARSHTPGGRYGS
jgi:hypothetical protein